jgi:hypothetical protein
VDEASHEVIAAVVATHEVGDAEVSPDVLEQIDDDIEQYPVMVRLTRATDIRPLPLTAPKRRSRSATMRGSGSDQTDTACGTTQRCTGSHRTTGT